MRQPTTNNQQPTTNQQPGTRCCFLCLFVSGIKLRILHFPDIYIAYAHIDKTTTCKQATYGMHIISTGAAWPVGVHWDVFQPLLNEKRAVAHTDAAYGVAPDNAAAERRKRKKQKMTYFFPTFCIQHGQPLQMIKRDSERVEINICDHDKSYETTTS